MAGQSTSTGTSPAPPIGFLIWLRSPVVWAIIRGETLAHLLERSAVYRCLRVPILLVVPLGHKNSARRHHLIGHDIMRRCRHPIGHLRRRIPVWPTLPMPSRRSFERLDHLHPAQPIAEAGVGILLAPSVRIPDRVVERSQAPSVTGPCARPGMSKPAPFASARGHLPEP
jgi:hypothetical protein